MLLLVELVDLVHHDRRMIKLHCILSRPWMISGTMGGKHCFAISRNPSGEDQARGLSPSSGSLHLISCSGAPDDSTSHLVYKGLAKLRVRCRRLILDDIWGNLVIMMNSVDEKNSNRQSRRRKFGRISGICLAYGEDSSTSYS